MESKYFTPDIEDFHVGYECEIYDQSTSKLIKKVEWHTVKTHLGNSEIGKNVAINQVLKYIKQNKLRVPYLTKEQIEAEGWERLEFEREELYGYKKANYFLVFNEKVKTINIILQDPSKESEISWGLQTSPERFKFFCECKSINELRTICKLLNIK